MKIRIIYNFAPTPKSYSGITIYPFIFTWYSKEEMPDSFLAHEMVHVEQVREIGWFSFYISYILYWLAGLVHYKSSARAYWEIPYEKEARDIAGY